MTTQPVSVSPEPTTAPRRITHQISSVVALHHQHYVITDSFDGAVRVWRTDNGGRMHRKLMQCLAGVEAVGVHGPTSRIARSGGCGTITICHAMTGTSQIMLEAPEGSDEIYGAVVWHPTGSALAAGCWNGLVTTWDVDRRQPHAAHQVHDGPVLCLAWWNDLVISGGADAQWVISSATSPLVAVKMEQPIVQVAVHPRQPLIAVLTERPNSTITLWRVPHGQLVGEVPMSSQVQPTSIAWRPDGRLLAWGGDDGSITLYDEREPRSIPLARKHTAATATALGWRDDGRILMSGQHDGRVRLWPIAATLLAEEHQLPTTSS